MRKYAIAGAGLLMAALFFAVPTAIAEAHSPHVAYVGRIARNHGYRVRPAYRRGVYMRHAYRPLRIVPPTARYPYWHYNTRPYRR